MRERLPGLAASLITTFFLSLTIIIVRLLTSADGGIMDFTILTVVGTLAIIWLVWALKIIDSPPATPASEKQKRGTTEDTRLSLLLELMDDDERQALKQRLLEDLGGDGENVSLAALLSAQDDKRSSSS